MITPAVGPRFRQYRFNPHTYAQDIEELVAAERSGRTPVEKAWARIQIAFLNWAIVHDTTEQLVGDPDWWQR